MIRAVAPRGTGKVTALAHVVAAMVRDGAGVRIHADPRWGVGLHFRGPRSAKP